MSVYIHCRLKPLNLAKKTLNRYLIPTRFSTQLAEASYFKNNTLNSNLKNLSSVKKKIKVKPSASYVPYTYHYLSTKYSFFSKEKKINIEVCCGSGDFLLNVAKAIPNEIFVGIDVALPCVQRAIKKAENMQLNNILFYCGSGEDFFTYDFKNIIVHRIMVNFPDPWPKKKHIKRRVVSISFLKSAMRCLEKKGQIIMVTDVPPLAREHFLMANFTHQLKPILPAPPNYYVGEAEDKFSSKFSNAFKMQENEDKKKLTEVKNNFLTQENMQSYLNNKKYLPFNFYSFNSAYQQKNLAKSQGFFISAHEKIN